jgi:hypothetical protein
MTPKGLIVFSKDSVLGLYSYSSAMVSGLVHSQKLRIFLNKIYVKGFVKKIRRGRKRKA